MVQAYKYKNPFGVGHGYNLRISDYAGDTPIEARKKIAKVFRTYGLTFGINVNPIIKQNIVDQVGELDNGQQVEAAVVTSGIVIANAYTDYTDNTGHILQGKPVAFDSVTGRAVTGINPNWSPEEYVIVGICLGGTNPISPGYVRIPIMLGIQEPPDVIRFGVLQEDLLHGGNADVRFYSYDKDLPNAGYSPWFVRSESLPLMKVETGPSGSSNLLPTGKKLPSGSLVIMGLMNAGGNSASNGITNGAGFPVWILLGSPTCPVDI